MSSSELSSLQSAESCVGFPSECWSWVIESLLGRSDMFAVMMTADWQIKFATPTFVREIDRGRDSGDFLDLLIEDSQHALQRISKSNELDTSPLQLHHNIGIGVRTIEYNFRAVDGGWVAVGRDQSVQLELIDQMTVLVQDLESTLRHERALADELRTLVSRDPLTGLANRRYLEETLESMSGAAVEPRGDFAILCIDIDHFKQVNDNHGHLLGDEVLRRVAAVLSSCVRDGDCTARYGGEEFVVVSRNADSAHALEIGERVRSSVEAAEMPDPVSKVTVSVGVATKGTASVPTTYDVLELADKALYDAKDAGRNCVRLRSE